MRAVCKKTWLNCRKGLTSSGEDDDQPHGGDGHVQGVQPVQPSQGIIVQSAIYQLSSSEDDMQLTLLDAESIADLNLKSEHKLCSRCCCIQHCMVANHNTLVWKKASEFSNHFPVSTKLDTIEEEELFDAASTIDEFERDLGDGITNILMSLKLNL